MKRSAVRGHFPTFEACRGWLRSRRLPRVRITVRRMMIAVAVVGAICAVGRGLLPEPPRVLALRQTAERHRLKAKMWGYYAKLSEEGVTTLEPGWLSDRTRGEVLGFNHFVPRPRPADPARAEAFDRECAAVAAKCRVMQAYYERLRGKWARAASEPWKVVPPDPPPPLPIEPSSVQDISF